MVVSELPQEILIDIFTRLPVKSVGQCRCLSKSWRRILSSHHFIKSHLNRQTHQVSLLLYDVSSSFHFIDTIKDGAVSRELQLPRDYSDYTQIVGSCDGVVLLVNGDNDQFLVNPVTQGKVIIPNSPLALQGYEGETASMYGFGYDSSIDDYKIVTLSYYKVYVDSDDEDEDEDEQEPDCEETFVDVYYVKRGVWERVESSPYNHAIPDPHSGAFLNNAIHWLARTRESSYRSVLVGFSLFDEVFTEIPTPDEIQMGDFSRFCRVVVLGGCLCIIDVRSGYGTYVWMMKEYGLVESWTKLSIGIGDQWGIGKPLFFVGDQEIASVQYGRPLRVYNPKERTFRDMIFDGVVALDDGVIFVPSLVSPDNEASLCDDAHLNAFAARLAMVLTIQSVLVQDLEESRTIMSASERLVDKCGKNKKAKVESKLRKYRGRLSELTRELEECKADIQELSQILRDTFVSTEWGKALIDEMCRQSCEAYRTSSEFQADFFGNVVRLCRRKLRESGHFNEDVIMLVGPGVPDCADVAIHKGAGSCGASIGRMLRLLLRL